MLEKYVTFRYYLEIILLVAGIIAVCIYIGTLIYIALKDRKRR